MKKQLTYIFIFNLLFCCVFPLASHAQTDTVTTVTDSVVYREKYGLRIGVDLSKPIRSLIDKNYKGFAVVADYRYNKSFFPTFEIGYENYDYDENNFSANSKGSYFKIGVNYNAYKNWAGMQNQIFVGLRYGFSTFSETLYDYTIYSKDHYFPPDTRLINKKFSGLSAHWLELQLGIKVEVLNNLYLGAHVAAKRILAEKAPTNFANLFIPGYNRRYQHSEFGMGWGYSISYLIPIYRKPITVKRE